MVHFVMNAVKLLKLDDAKLNTRGTGSAQYPPSMMLGLLIYCYATGTFSSRKIEQLSHDSVAVRYLCAQHHPDHDSICKFRRENGKPQHVTKVVKALYAQRKETVEPVFGIIKAAMGFRMFSLRGQAKVSLEWTLVTLSYNLKRLFHAGAKLQGA